RAGRGQQRPFTSVFVAAPQRQPDQVNRGVATVWCRGSPPPAPARRPRPTPRRRKHAAPPAGSSSRAVGGRARREGCMDSVGPKEIRPWINRRNELGGVATGNGPCPSAA